MSFVSIIEGSVLQIHWTITPLLNCFQIRFAFLKLNICRLAWHGGGFNTKVTLFKPFMFPVRIWLAWCLITQKPPENEFVFSLEQQNGVVLIHLFILPLDPSYLAVQEKHKSSWLMDLLAIWTSVLSFIVLAGRGLGTVWQASTTACTNTR